MKDEHVDDIMARCPLKQEVRQELWVRFARKVSRNRPLTSYLTLYSPPMMDIQHFHQRGLIEFNGESFGGVIAVTYVEDHYAEAMARTSGRPHLLLHGDINKLLAKNDTTDAKRLRGSFPIQVLNLDYTNALFSESNTAPVSEHLRAVEEIIRLQRRSGASQFVLFVTTRAERKPRDQKNELSREFLSDLASRVDANVAGNRPFAKNYSEVFGELRGADLLRENYDAFVPIGVSKLFAQMLAEHHFEILETGGVVLVRDKRRPARWLLHLAFHVKASEPPRASRLRSLGQGRQFYFERRVSDFVKLVGNSKLRWIRESADGEQLQGKHGAYVEKLAGKTLDLPIPEPTKRES